MRNIDSHKQEAFPYHWRTLATKTGFHQAFHGCQLRISRRVTGGPRVKTPVALVAIECCLGCCLKHLHLHVFGGRVLWGVCRSALWKQTSSEPKIHAKENQNRYIVLISNITGIVNPIETCSPSFFQHLRRGVALLHLHMGYHWNLGSAPNQGKMLSQGTQCASHRPGLTAQKIGLSGTGTWTKYANMNGKCHLPGYYCWHLPLIWGSRHLWTWTSTQGRLQKVFES